MTNYSTYWTPQKQKEYQKDYIRKKRQENPDIRIKMNERTKEWGKNNPEKKLKSIRTWQKNNPEKYLKYKRRHNAKKHRIKQKEAMKLLGNKCFVCGISKEKSKPMLVIHKKDGISHRGITTWRLALKQPEDFVLLCKYPCHIGIHFLLEKVGLNWNQIEILIKNKAGIRIKEE